MTKPPDAGYDEPDRDIDEIEVTWEVRLYERQYMGTGHLLSVSRNGEPVGMIRVKHVREYEWLKKRINGKMEVRDE